MSRVFSRRDFLCRTFLVASGVRSSVRAEAGEASPSDLSGLEIEKATFGFIERCARDNGGYSASPDPGYPGNSDTAESDLAAVTYAATLAKSVGWKLPHPGKSAEFIQRHQQPDGAFVNFQGNLAPKSDLAILYNTVQGAVSLRALGEKPKASPVRVMERFFEAATFKKLPWYTISFYPLFYAALGEPFPKEYCAALERHIVENQAPDGYLGDHVASTFHLAHFFRLIGKPTPKAAEIVERVLRDQRPDGGWQLKAPDWDVHACFDAVFILRQLGGNSGRCHAAISKAADWALSCRNADAGFGHYPGRHSDVDAVYFQFATLIQAGRIPGTNSDLPDAETLSWGHAMKPETIYPHP